MIKAALLTGVSAVLVVMAGVSTAMADPALPVYTSTSDAFASISAGLNELSVDPAIVGAINGPTLEGAASASYNFTPMLGVQGDVVYRTQNYSEGGYTLYEHDFEAAGHVFTRNDQFLLGAFAQYGDGVGGIDGYGLDISHYMVGGEAQVFAGDATLYGQIAYKRYTLYTVDLNGWFGNFEARYFLQPNFKVEAHIGMETLNDGFVTDSNETTLNAGVGAEYRFDNTPFSVFAKYDFARNSFQGADYNILSNRILIGAKLNFDAPTLLARDRTGASLKPVDSHDFDYLALE